MLCNKKNLAIFLFSFFVFSLSALSSVNNIQEYTLENGMQVFLLEEPADALVHIEFNCRAGFSSQTQETCGFFKLFTRLVKAANPQLEFYDVQCNSDTSRYFIDVSPSQVSQTLAALSDAVFSPDYSDELLRQELTSLKKEVSDNAATMSYYINAAIDSRVFSDAPWKHDSGIYPPLFKSTSEKKARAYLKEISDYWYTPKNSAVFISGNINTEQILTMLKNSFGRFYSNYNTPVQKASLPRNNQRKFVFHSNEISADLTQLVIQYTMLDTIQAELMAIALGYEGSLFKQVALSYSDLNIPGDEYINVSAAHKKDSSRLIIQTLLQPPEDQKKNKKTITSLEQTQLFLQQIDLIPGIVQPEEFEYAKNQSIYSLNRTANVSTGIMEQLSSFWAMRQYMTASEIADTEDFQSETAAEFMQQIQTIQNNLLSDSLETLKSEAPFIFVIINSKDYKANKKAYEQAGFEEINEKNASWYVQKLFENVRQSEAVADTTNSKFYITSEDNSYYQKNKDSISQFVLSNGIRVTTKENPASSTLSLLLSINGGKYSSYDDIGFEEVMITLLSGLIQKGLYAAQGQGLITGAVNVTSQTELSTGQIIIEFDTVDSVAAIRTIANSIVYGEIAPADADRAVSGRKYRKRLENGTAEKQMYSKMIESVYKKGNFSEVFDAEKEILMDTDYTKILSAYPRLLDASRYSIIACGGLPENLSATLEESFGLFTKTGASDIKQPEYPELTASNTTKDIKAKVRHTFLTDIPAEKAGPQPAVLIPTTEFLDPVILAGKAPEPGTKQAALYNALINYICSVLSEKYTATVQLPRYNLNIGSITVQNVAHTRELDADYKTIVSEISENLDNMTERAQLLRKIKAGWTQSQMRETASNTGTAMLLQKGTELFPENPDSFYYLEEYNYIQTATAQDFKEIMEYFPVRPQIRVYSTDSKK